MKTGLMLALAGAVLLFATLFNDAYSLPKLLVLALGAAAAWLGISLDGGRGLRATPLDRPLAALAAAMVLATLFSIDRPVSLLGRYYSYAYGMLPTFVCIALYYAAAAWRTERRARRLLRLCALAGAASGAYAVLQRLGFELFPGVTARLPGGRPISASGDPFSLGAMLLLLAPAALSLSFDKDGDERMLGLVCMGLIAAGLLLTLSGGALLGALAGCASYAVLSGRLPSPKGWKPDSLKALLAALLAAAALGAMVCGARDTATGQTWRIGLRSAASRPLTGTGPDTMLLSFRRNRDEDSIRTMGDRRGHDSAHNDLIQAASTAGLLGLAAYLWLLAAAALMIRRTLSEPGRRDTAAAVAGGLLGLFVHAKLLPTPLAALAAASVWTGLCVPRDSGPGAPEALRRSVPWTVFAACALFSAVLILFAAADRSFRLALRSVSLRHGAEATARLERAESLNPWEMLYKVALNRFLLQQGGAEGGPEERNRALARAVAVGRDAVSRHPGDPAAYNMLGFSLWMYRKYAAPGDLEETAAVLDRALELDPYFIPLIQARMLVAEKKQDAAALEGLRGRIESIRSLSTHRAPAGTPSGN